MQKILSRWMQNVFLRRPVQRVRRTRRAHRVESLEDRVMLDVTLSSIAAAEIGGGKDLFVPLEAVDDEQDPITFSAESDNPDVTAEVLTGGRSLLIDVEGVDSNGAAFSGELTLRLFESIAPDTTARIIELVEQGFYDDDPATTVEDSIFHRVVDGFVAQAGDPVNRDGTGGTGMTFDDEFDRNVTFVSPGLLATANSGDDTNDSQFFIVDIDVDRDELPQHLNFNHTIFGTLTSGFDTFQNIMTTPIVDENDNGTIDPGESTPVDDVVINSIQVFDDTQNGVLRVDAPEDFMGTAEITVTADDGNGDVDMQVFDVTGVPDTVNDRAFLGEVTDVTTDEDTPVTFDVEGIDLEQDTLNFVVRDENFQPNPDNVAVGINVSPPNGNPNSVAEVTLDPAEDFNGTVVLTLGVRDQTDRTGQGIDDPDNFDTQVFELTVNPVNDAPIADNVFFGTEVDQAVQVQLSGDDGDPEVDQSLMFEIVEGPDNGQVTNFDMNTGTFDYTPDTGFQGIDRVTYRVIDDGGTQNGGEDTSAEATARLNVGVQSALVELIDGDLVITDSVGDANLALTVERDGDEIVVRDPNNPLMTTDGQLVNDNEVRVDAADVTGGLVVSAGGGNDSVDASDSGLASTLNGGSGDDSLTGSDGDDDSLSGGDGNDVLTGMGGDDTLDGGAGDADRIVERGDVDFTLSDIQLTGNGTDTLNDIEEADLRTGDGPNPGSNPNTLDSTGFSGNTTLFAGAGSDTIMAGAGDDFLNGNGDFDEIDGGGGNDFIYGGGALDSINGGDGDDSIFGQGGLDSILGGDGDDFLNGNASRDNIDGGAGDDFILGGANHDTIRGGDGADIIHGQGLRDAIDGGAGNDVLNGRAGSDTIAGGAGDDQLLGGAGQDQMAGQDGDDTVDGQGGSRDVLAGGSGDGSDPGDNVIGSDFEIDESFSINFDMLFDSIDG